MPDWLFQRSTVIALAIAGGLFSVVASWSQSKSWMSKRQLHLLNRAAYFCMGASMVLFVCAGLLGMGSSPGS